MKKENCTIFVPLLDMSHADRRDAAFWCIKTFGKDNVDVMHPREKIGSRGVMLTPGFWFAREKDATMCRLKYS